jgi:hypothetical protein
MHSQSGDGRLSVNGTVVEILERGGERFARIVLEPGTVVEVPAPPSDVSLGDRVVVDASLRIERVRDGAGGHPIVETPGPAPPDRPRGRLRLRFHDYEHVLRMAGLFAVGIVVFLAWRSWMVPDDFGVYGHFRAGAITDAANQTPRFAGQAVCIGCHDEVQQVRLTGHHANVRCEACHGPLGAHASGDTDVAPVRPSSRAVCLTCHTARTGMPKAFPSIVVKEHSESGPCTECHAAHAPQIS